MFLNDGRFSKAAVFWQRDLRRQEVKNVYCSVTPFQWHSEVLCTEGQNILMCPTNKTCSLHQQKTEKKHNLFFFDNNEMC